VKYTQVSVAYKLSNFLGSPWRDSDSQLWIECKPSWS